MLAGRPKLRKVVLGPDRVFLYDSAVPAMYMQLAGCDGTRLVALVEANGMVIRDTHGEVHVSSVFVLKFDAFGDSMEERRRLEHKNRVDVLETIVKEDQDDQR